MFLMFLETYRSIFSVSALWLTIQWLGATPLRGDPVDTVMELQTSRSPNESISMTVSTGFPLREVTTVTKWPIWVQKPKTWIETFIKHLKLLKSVKNSSKTMCLQLESQICRVCTFSQKSSISFRYFLDTETCHWRAISLHVLVTVLSTFEKQL